MRVVHLNTSDTQGGAARAAYRLHRGLAELGVDSRMLVRDKVSDDDLVQAPRTRAARVLTRAAGLADHVTQLAHPRRTPGVFTSTWLPTRISAEARAMRPDLVNLHWVGFGFLAPESLAPLGRQIVWTLHDSYAFTGGCHVPADCTRYASRCGACPSLGSSALNDLSRLIWLRKKRAWRSVDLTIVAPSRWMAECALRSSLLRERRIEVIPNGLDTSAFRPVDRGIARQLLRLPSDKRIVLFVAEGGAANPMKGFSHLAEATRLIARQGRELVELVVAGASTIPSSIACGVPVRCLGTVRDDLTLAMLNSAADVAVVPSLQENLANTVIEALACGTPVVAYRIGGMPDMIIDRVNGVLVEPFDVGALAGAILWAIEDPQRRLELSGAAREKAQREYALEVQARRYATLYEDLLRVRSAH